MEKTKIIHADYKIDAEGMILGRLATDIVSHLIGKYKATYQPNVDSGDTVTVINMAKIKVTGKKMDQKLYYRHTNYPGGLRTKQLSKLMEEDPTMVLIKAVSRMLPKNKLRNERMKRLTIS